MTIELMAAAVRCLTQDMSYAVPPQDLSIGRGRIPGLPRSGFVMDNVRALDPASRLANSEAAAGSSEGQ